MTCAAIGLGGNLGDAATTLRQAIEALGALPGTRLLRASRLYRTPAWGLTAQPDFINAVAVVETTLAPGALLDHLLAIERRFGRVRVDGERWGPRTLDLDLLLHGEARLDVPGLQLREVHGKSGFELSLQGLSGDQVLVLIDGLPITASTGSTVDLGQYLVGEVERVEVVKGASSAQYGSSAMGGVVNVITRRIQPGFGATLEVDAGSYGRQNDSGRRASANQKHARFGLSGGGETWRLALSGDVLDDAGFGLRPELWTRQGDASERVQLTGRAEWLPRAGQRFWLEAGRYSEDDVQRYEYFVPSKYVPQRKSEDIARDRVVLGSQWRLDGGARLQAKAVREHYDSDSREVSDGYQIARRNSAQQTQHLSTQVELPAWGRQVWMLGADWHRETLRQTTNGNSELQFNGRAQRDSRELFLQNDIFLNDDWELLLGVRGQHDSDFGGHAVPKVSLRGTLLERGDWRGVLRASAGAGYRVPNLKERHYLFDHSSLGYIVIGNPNLQPESSTSLQLGGTLSLGSRWSLDGNLFHNRVKDLIQTDLGNATSVQGVTAYTYANVARARTAGLEAQLRWQATPALALQAGYTRTHTRDLESGGELTRRPRDMARLGVDWKLQQGTTFTARARYQSDELADSVSGQRSPAWSVLDLGLGHGLGGGWTVFAGINNAFNRQRDFASASDFGPIAGRFVYVGAKWAFGAHQR